MWDTPSLPLAVLYTINVLPLKIAPLAFVYRCIMIGKKLSIDRLKTLYDEGLSLRGIARELEISHGCVRDWLDRAGVSRRPVGGRLGEKRPTPPVPPFVPLNAAGVAGMTIAIAHILARRSRERDTKPATPNAYPTSPRCAP